MTTSTERDGEPTPDVNEPPWGRLSARMIWVDAIQSILSLAPGAIAIWVVGVEPDLGSLWPLALIAVFGVVGAVTDALRWVFTRYRVTATEVQRRTGVFVRRYRSFRRDRIRSVDTNAKLRHRLARLRVVSIGAGQQTGAGEAALDLDALTKADAEWLRRDLLRERTVTEGRIPAGESDGDDGAVGEGGPDEVEVYARLRPWWVVYNVFSIWAYAMAAGILWAVFWLSSTVGVDLIGMVAGMADWRSLGWPRVIALAALGAGIIGAVGMAVNFFTSFWRFELARVRTGHGSFLRTRRGLFNTREVNRDESRKRGLSIDEPLLWRWMGMADTNLITTGLGLWSPEQPTALLPRGPISVARHVSVCVLGESSPLTTLLNPHPSAALRRRLTWATALVVGMAGLIVWPVWTGVAPAWVLWIVLGLWPLTLLLALVAYRALGHTIHGDYLVTRSGLWSRSTVALRRDAVSTVAVRQSILQRRLGLATVSAMTAAGWSAYEAPDVAAERAFTLADRAAPGLLDPYVTSERRAC